MVVVVTPSPLPETVTSNPMEMAEDVDPAPAGAICIDAVLDTADAEEPLAETVIDRFLVIFWSTAAVPVPELATLNSMACPDEMLAVASPEPVAAPVNDAALVGVAVAVPVTVEAAASVRSWVDSIEAVTWPVPETAAASVASDVAVIAAVEEPVPVAVAANVLA